MNIIFLKFVIALGISALFASLVFFIKPIQKFVYLIINSDPLNYYKKLYKSFADTNPGQSWKTISIEVDRKTIDVPFPDWGCWTMYHDPELFNRLSDKFVEELPRIDSNTKICALTQPALFFLGKIDDVLEENGAVIFPFEKDFPVPKEWAGSKLILFDINLNSGKTMGNAYTFFKSKKCNIANLQVIFYNDLIPHVKEFTTDPFVREKLLYILKASDIIKFWERHDVTNAVNTVREAIKGNIPWEDKAVINALKLLKTEPNVGKKSNITPLYRIE